MTPMDPGIRFPGESEEYRRERNQLLQAESELRRQIETVAAQRRALPPGGLVPDDYRFEDISDGREVRFSELFERGKDTLVIYSFMFPRYSGDTRPGPAEGETAKLPLIETPCASCTSIAAPPSAKSATANTTCARSARQAQCVGAACVLPSGVLS